MISLINGPVAVPAGRMEFEFYNAEGKLEKSAPKTLGLYFPIKQLYFIQLKNSDCRISSMEKWASAKRNLM